MSFLFCSAADSLASRNGYAGLVSEPIREFEWSCFANKELKSFRHVGPGCMQGARSAHAACSLTGSMHKAGACGCQTNLIWGEFHLIRSFVSALVRSRLRRGEPGSVLLGPRKLCMNPLFADQHIHAQVPRAILSSFPSLRFTQLRTRQEALSFERARLCSLLLPPPIASVLPIDVLLLVASLHQSSPRKSFNCFSIYVKGFQKPIFCTISSLASYVISVHLYTSEL